MRMTVVVLAIPAGLRLENWVLDLEALDRLEGNHVLAVDIAADGALSPLLIARVPGRHPLRVLRGILGLWLGQLKRGLVVRTTALIAQARGADDQFSQLQHVPKLVHVTSGLVESTAAIQYR